MNNSEFLWICLTLQHRDWYYCMQVEEQEKLLLHVKSLKSVGQNKIRHNKPAMDKRVGRSKYPRGGRVSTLGTLADVTRGDTKA